MSDAVGGQRTGFRRWLRDPLFLVCVLVPGGLATVYQGWVASDVYIAEATFVVHNEDPRSPGKLSALLAGVGLPPADETASAVEASIRSRETLQVLNRELKYDASVSAASVDPWARFGVWPWRRGFEYLLLYYRDQIEFSEGGSPNVLTLSVRAFDPDQAHRVAQRLVDLADQKVNALDRAVRDEVVQFAVSDLNEAQRQSAAADAALAKARSGHGVYDPDRQVVVPLTVLGKLEEEVAAARTLLGSLERMAPKNPQVPVLRRQIEGLEAQLQRERASVAGAEGSLASLAQSLDAMQVEHVAASRVVSAAIESLTAAKADARRRRVYLERIADPVRPDVPLEPHRLRAILATWSLGLLIFGLIRLLVSAVREHQH